MHSGIYDIYLVVCTFKDYSNNNYDIRHFLSYCVLFFCLGEKKRERKSIGKQEGKDENSRKK